MFDEETEILYKYINSSEKKISLYKTMIMKMMNLYSISLRFEREKTSNFFEIKMK